MTKTLSEGDLAPKFSMEDDTGSTISSDDYAGRSLVIFFYPKDNTPGCTTEAKDFSQKQKEFKALGVDILGVSRDSVKKHQNFKAKQDLTVALGADVEGNATEDFGVWVEKTMFGKKYMGIERSTFLIGNDGKIARIWRKVKVGGHVDDVLAAAKEL